jgi:hypothetical protein
MCLFCPWTEPVFWTFDVLSCSNVMTLLLFDPWTGAPFWIPGLRFYDNG